MIEKKTFILSGLHAIMAVGLDFYFHLTYTSPQETTIYFLFKFLLVFVIGLWLWSKITTLKIFLSVIIFVGVFSLYYRLLEQFYSIPFGGRVPDILIFGREITYYNEPISSILFWGIIHGISFLIPLFILKQWRK